MLGSTLISLEKDGAKKRLVTRNRCLVHLQWLLRLQVHSFKNLQKERLRDEALDEILCTAFCFIFFFKSQNLFLSQFF
jgi:hypothetical protein